MRVLVAEDDGVVRATIVRTIESLGWRAMPAPDGLAALAELSADQELSLAVLDWMMPGLEGIEVARRVRAVARAHYLYVILVTSRSSRADVLAALRAGVDDLLPKPFDPELLVARLEVGRRVVEAEARSLGRLPGLDELTRLPTKDAIVDRLAREAERCSRVGELLSVALVDVLRLRSLNESEGRAAGDAALRSVAERLRAALRESDSLGRYGGDEFLIALPGCDEAGAARCAARLQRHVAATLRVCIGCATTRGAAFDLELLIMAADLALHRAKLSGLSGWAVASDEDWAASHP